MTHRAGTRRTGLSLAPTRALALGLGLASAAPNVFAHGAIKGIGNMPPKGGNPSLTDAQIRAAVAYQIKTNR